MKKIIYISILFAAFLFGCDAYETLTEDPNRPVEVHPSLLLTNIEVGILGQISVSAAHASRYLVFTDGYSTSQTYGWQRAGFGAYNSMLQVKKMMEEAEKKQLNNYQAIGKFFRAYYFHQMTLTFGDVPYSEALQGEDGNFAPRYDKQMDVFIGILDELTEANENLSADGGEISGDILYEGDILKWKKLINSFKVRVLISLSAKEGISSLDIPGKMKEIFDNPETYPLFSSLEEQAQLVYIDRDDNRYPLYNDRSIQTANYMEASFVKLLKARLDPRLFKFAAPERVAVEVAQPGYEKSFSSFNGLEAGAYVNDNVQLLTEEGIGSPLNPRYYSEPENEPSISIGYPELMFNLAEAALRGWITADPEDLYLKGIRASMQFYGIEDARIQTYLDGRLVKYDEATAMEQINIQKYLAFFLNSGWECFYNQRRTGIPTFSVGPSTQNGGSIPKRWMYPQSELDNNFDNVEIAVNSQFDGNDNINGLMWLLIIE